MALKWNRQKKKKKKTLDTGEGPNIEFIKKEGERGSRRAHGV